MNKIIYLFLAILLVITSSLAQTTQNTTSQDNAINKYLQQELNSNAFSFIGLPENIRLDHLAIYLIIICGVILIIYDVLNMASFIDKKPINFGIATIVVLLGTINQIAYKLIQPIYNFQELLKKVPGIKSISVLITIGIIFGVIFIFKLLKKIFSKAEHSANKERMQILGEDLALDARLTRIRLRGEGVKK